MILNTYPICPHFLKAAEWVVWAHVSGGSDVRGLHNDTCTHLVGVTGQVFVGRCPSIGMIADEGVRVLHARHFEIRLSWVDEGGHARKRTGSNRDQRGAVVLLPDVSAILVKRKTNPVRNCSWIVCLYHCFSITGRRKHLPPQTHTHTFWNCINTPLHTIVYLLTLKKTNGIID